MSSHAYVCQRSTDALALLNEIRALLNELDWADQMQFTLYGVAVLITRHADYVEVMWADPRSGRMHDVEGLSDFLAWVLRRYW